MRIAVAEDVVLMRQGIVAVLAGGGHEVVWQTGTASDVLSRFRQAEPDVLVTDVRMPPGHSDDGLRAALGVREEFPDAGILVLSQYVGNEYARRLLAGAHGNSGGTGYLLKESVGRISQFLCAVEEVGAGGVSIDPRVVTELFARPAASPLDELSPGTAKSSSSSPRGGPTPRSPGSSTCPARLSSGSSRRSSSPSGSPSRTATGECWPSSNTSGVRLADRPRSLRHRRLSIPVAGAPTRS